MSTMTTQRTISSELSAAAPLPAAGRPSLRSWPEWVTLGAIFLAYTNAAAVGVHFHGLPSAAAAAVLLLPAVPLAIYLLRDGQPILVTPALPWVALFVLIQSASAVRADRPDVAADTLFVLIGEGLVVFFLLTNVIRDTRLLQQSVWALLVAGALLGGLSLFQQLTRTYDNNYGGFAQMSNAEFRTGDAEVEVEDGESDPEASQRRLAGPIGETNRYAQVMLMLVPLGLFHMWGGSRPAVRGLAALATFLIMIGVTLTFSRGALVGAAVLLVALIYLGRLRPAQIGVIVLGLVSITLLVPQSRTRVASLLDIVPGVRGPEFNVASADGSVRSRLTEMLAGAAAFLDHPVLGVGPGMFRYHYRDYAEDVGLRLLDTTRRAHCLYVELAAETGLLGLACFGVILSVVFIRLVRARTFWRRADPRLSHTATGLLLALLAYLVTGVFLHFAYIRYFWLVVAVAAAAGDLGVAASQRQPAPGPTEDRPCCN